MAKADGQNEPGTAKVSHPQSDIPHIKVDDPMRGTWDAVLEFQRQKYHLHITSKGKFILSKCRGHIGRNPQVLTFVCREWR